MLAVVLFSITLPKKYQVINIFITHQSSTYVPLIDAAGAGTKTSIISVDPSIG